MYRQFSIFNSANKVVVHHDLETFAEKSKFPKKNQKEVINRGMNN